MSAQTQAFEKVNTKKSDMKFPDFGKWFDWADLVFGKMGMRESDEFVPHIQNYLEFDEIHGMYDNEKTVAQLVSAALEKKNAK